MAGEEDLAKLGIEIDASQAPAAEAKLDSLTAAAGRTEVATGKLKTATQIMREEHAKLATASAQTAEASDGLANRATKLLNALDPLTKAQSVHAAQMKEIGLLYKADAISATERAAAIAASEKILADAFVNTEHAATGSSIKIRESLVLMREAARGDMTRMAGSASILAGAFGLVTSSTIAMGAAFLVALAPLALLAIAANKGANEQSKLNNELQLTANYAGITASSYYVLGKSIAEASNSSISTANSALNVLIGSGKISGDTLKDLANASVLLSQRTGETAENTAKDFLKMTDGVTKFATEFADKYGALISPAQLEYIAKLERQGEKELAEQALAKDVYENLSKLSVEKLGYISYAWQQVSKAASDYWQYIKDIGKDTTLQQQADQLTQTIALLEKSKTAFGPHSDLTQAGQATQQQIDLDNAQLSVVNALIKSEADRAAAQSKAATDAAAARKGVIDQLKIDEENAKRLTEQAKQEANARNTLIKEAQTYIETLQKQAASSSQGAIAEKELEVQLNANKFAAIGLGDAIEDAGQAAVLALGDKELGKVFDDFNKKLTTGIDNAKNFKSVITATGVADNPNALPGIISLATGQTQGTGDGKNIVKDDGTKQSILEAKAYLDILEKINQETKRAAASMAEAFGSVGKAVGGLSSVMSDYQVQQHALAIKHEEDLAKGINLEQVNADFKRQSAANELQYNADLIGSTKELFSQKSIMYKALTVAEDFYRAQQLLTAVQQIYTDATTTASGVAAAGTQATAWGVTAFARTLASLPFPFNLAAGAAVLAALAGIGVAISGGGHSGVVAGANDAANRQKVDGSGTVLGDQGALAGSILGNLYGAGYGGAKSDSITQSITNAEKNSNQMLEYTNQMVQSLHAIESNIGKLTSAIARNLGVGGSFDSSGLGLGTSIGGTLLDPIGSLFGLSSTHTTKSLQDFGLTFKDQTLSSIASGILGNVYQQVLTSSSTNILGIKVSSSTSVGTTNSALPTDISNQIGLVINSLKTGVLDAAAALGVTGAQATLDSFKVSLGTLSFQGLTSSQIQDELNSVFGKLGDQLTTALIPGITQLQQAGEGALDTLTRLAREYQIVDTTLKSMGTTFGAVGLSSVSARDRLVQLAGGLDAFTSKAQFFVENMLTNVQQLDPVVRSVATEMANLGESGITTKAQFVQLVQSLDLSTQSGQDLYNALLNVAPAFNKVADAVVAYTSASTGIFNELATINGKTTANQLAIARANFSTGLSKAQSGDLNALNNLPALAQSFADASKAGATSATSFNRDLATIKTGLASALAVSNSIAKGANLQQLQLQAAQDALLQTQDTQAILQQQNGFLQAIVNNTAALAANTATGAFTGTPATVATTPAVDLAVANTVTAITAANSNDLTLAQKQAAFKADLNNWADTPSNVAAAAALGLTHWSPKFGFYERGGSFGGGWRVVGERGPELEQTGPSRITSNADLKKMLSNDDLIVEMQKMRKEIVKLQTYAKKTSDTLRNVTQDGNSILTTAA